MLRQIDNEERTTVRQRLSRESGYTGISALYRLSFLTGFDVCHDSLTDVMHNVPMNVDKKYVDHLVNSENLDEKEVDKRLQMVDWNNGKDFRLFLRHKFVNKTTLMF